MTGYTGGRPSRAGESERREARFLLDRALDERPSSNLRARAGANDHGCGEAPRRKAPEMNCPACGDHEVRRSRRRVLERILSAFGLFPYRCQRCDARFLRFGAGRA